MNDEIQYTEPPSDEDAVAPDLAQALAGELAAIAPEDANRLERIGDLRRRMDAACDVGDLTIREWRALIEKVAATRSEAASGSPRSSQR